MRDFLVGCLVSLLGLVGVIVGLAGLTLVRIWPLLVTGPDTPDWAICYMIVLPLLAIVAYGGLEYAQEKRREGGAR